MGHNRKNANRTEAINRNAEKLETNRKEIAKLRAEFRKNKTDRDRELLDFEKRLLDEIIELRAENIDLLLKFNDLTRPKHRKASAWIRNVLQKAPSSPKIIFDEFAEELAEKIATDADGREIIDIQFDDEATDPAVVVTMDGRPADIGQEDDIEPFTLAEIAKASDEIIESSRKRNEEDDKRKIIERLHDPKEVLKRLEARLDAEKGIAADIMENQELDQEERAAAMDRSITNIEQFKSRIAHQKLIIDGIAEAP